MRHVEPVIASGMSCPPRDARQRRGFAALLIPAVLLSLVTWVVTSAVVHPLVSYAAGPSRVTEFAEPSGSAPELEAGTATGRDGNVWFTNYGTNEIGKITPSGVITRYALASGANPFGISAGPDGNLWFAEYGANKIGKISTSGSITTYPVPTAGSGPVGVVAGSDGNIWFTEYEQSKIGKITTSGTFTEYAIGSATAPVGIAAGSDGNLWFAQETGSKIGKITTSGTITQYSATAGSTPFYMTSGPDGNVWFTEEEGNRIGKVTTAGTISEYSIPTGGSDPHGITSGADGNVWFTEFNANKLGSITTSGTITEYDVIPTAGSTPEGIVSGADNNLWFTESHADKIGRYVLSPVGGALKPAQAPTGKPYCIPCNSAVATATATKNPVNTESGNFFHTFDDISIPGRSYPLQITRTYNSQNASVDGPFGYGWSYNSGLSLAVSGTSPNQVATITQEDSSQATFNQPASGSTWAPSAPRFIATLTYDSGSSTWTFVRKGQDTYTFDSSGQLTQITDLNGYTTSLSYTSGNLTTVTDPAGRTLTLGWTSTHITSVTDANVSGNTRTVAYSYTSGNLTDVTDVNTGDTNFGYDSSHRVTTMKDPVCEATSGCPGIQNHYDSSGRVDWQKDQLNRETTFAYSGDPQSASGGSTIITDPASNEVQDTYENGVLVETIHGYGTSSAATTLIVYDPLSLTPTAITDPNSNATGHIYDSSGNILTATDPLGRVTTNTYNSFNEVLTTEDPNGVTTTNSYDGIGNLTRTCRPLPGGNCGGSPSGAQVTTYNHADATHPGDVTSVVDPDAKTTTMTFDSYGKVASSTDPLSNETTSTYNADGFPLTTASPKGNVSGCSCASTYTTTSTYNKSGQLLTSTDPLSHVVTKTYDADGNLVTSEDPNSNTTTYTYDVANEPTTTSRPDSTTTVTDYNADGTVLDEKDGKGNAILTYGYDSLARVITSTDALGNVTTFTYDAAGNRLTQQDPGGNCATPSKCTTTTYDADNEPTAVTYSDGVTPNITSISYDSDGQRTGMTDGTGTSAWVHDSLHRVTSYTNGQGTAVSYAYNLRDLPTTITYPGSHAVTNSYDDAARMTSVQDWLGTPNTTSFGYDVNSNLTSDTLQSGIVDSYTYNASNQQTAISDVSGATTIFAATYTRDSNGQLASDTSQAANQGAYKYTSLNQLCYAGSSSSNACTSAPSSSYPYGLDAADNLTTMENAGHSGTNAQQFNAADELCWIVAGASANACGSAPTGATAFNYDDRGNRTSQVPGSGPATCTAFDQADRLTSVKTGTGSSCTSPTTAGTYAYDGSGMRQSKTVSGTTTQFLWSGGGSTAALLDEKAGSANPTYYIYGPGGRPVEQVDPSGNAHFYHVDQIGSVRAVTNTGGTTDATYTYDPYGSVVTSTNPGSITNNLQFQGQYVDAESGLYYLRARYYDPATAQFMSLDPMVDSTMSPYAYVGGNPLNGADPTGMFGWGNITSAVSHAVHWVGNHKAAAAAFVTIAVVVAVACVALCVEGAVAGGVGAVAEAGMTRVGVAVTMGGIAALVGCLVLCVGGTSNQDEQQIYGSNYRSTLPGPNNIPPFIARPHTTPTPPSPCPAPTQQGAQDGPPPPQPGIGGP